MEAVASDPEARSDVAGAKSAINTTQKASLATPIGQPLDALNGCDGIQSLCSAQTNALSPLFLARVLPQCCSSEGRALTLRLQPPASAAGVRHCVGVLLAEMRRLQLLELHARMCLIG